MPAQLTKNIFQTIIYYDILNYSLTSLEVWKHLLPMNNDQGLMINRGVESFTLGEIVEALESEEVKKNIEEFRGFYFLPGRKDLVERRIENNKISIEKYKIAKKVVWWLRFVPFVRMVAVTGTLAMKNPERDSDIDFFVVLEKGRIWTGRALVTLAVYLLGRRRHGKKIKNRVCLNYFITTGSLEIKRRDLFAANEYTFIYPIFDSLVIPSPFNFAQGKLRRGICENNAVASYKNIHEDPSAEFILNRAEGLGMTKKSIFCRFCEANVGWIKKFKPNWEIPELKPAKHYINRSQASQAIQKAKETLINIPGGDIIEYRLKKWQIRKIENNPLTHKKGGYVEYTDENLVFLPVPQSVRIEEEFRKRLKLLTSI